jgi:hypothetical protein
MVWVYYTLLSRMGDPPRQTQRHTHTKYSHKILSPKNLPKTTPTTNIPPIGSDTALCRYNP